MRGIRGNLRVVTERKTLVRLLHHPCLRITGAHPRLTLDLFSGPACLQLLQLFERTFEPLLLLASRTGLRLLCLRTTLVVPGIAHRRHPLSRLFQMLANRLLVAITPAARQRLNLRAVLRHLLQGYQSFLAERRQHLREQFIQLLLFFHTEIRQGVVVHFR